MSEQVFGLDKTLEEYETLGRDYGRRTQINFKIDEGARDEWFNLENGLYRKKWFDYRLLHPTQATYQFAHDYKIVYRDYYRSNIDALVGEFVSVFNREDVFDIEIGSDEEFRKKWKRDRRPAELLKEQKNLDKRKTMMAGLWQVRQVADMMGMPYPIFIRESMGETLRCWRSKYIPKPSHLVRPFVLEKVQARWEERQNAMLMKAENPVYLNENYEGIWYQNEHHEWLFKQIDKASNRHATLARLIWEDKLLPEEKARGRFSPEDLQTAITFR
jgi:hypothetical protein